MDHVEWAKNLPKTVICDIDGCFILQDKDLAEREGSKAFHVLPGTRQKLKEWEKKNCSIILITARRESQRKMTEQMLEDLGIYYDQLIMGVRTGQRVLINDLKPEAPQVPMAVAINLERNKGIGQVDV